MPLATPELRHISLYEPLGINWFLEDTINSALFLNSRMNINTFLQKAGFQNSIRKMAFASPASQKVIGLKTAVIFATIYNYPFS